MVVRLLAWHAVVVTHSSSAITPQQPVELYPGDIKSVLLTTEQIQARISELGERIGNDYRDLAVETGEDLLLITVLKGAVMFVTDLARAIPLPTICNSNPALCAVSMAPRIERPSSDGTVEPPPTSSTTVPPRASTCEACAGACNGGAVPT